MAEQIADIVRTIDWLAWLVTMHYVGIVISLTAVLIGDAIALLVLFRDGKRVPNWVVAHLHSAVLLGLCVVWLSGTAIAVTKFTFATLPPKLVFKLGAATLLSFNALLLQHYLLPMLNKPRPLAVHLSRFDLFKVVTIGATSACAWSAITAVAFLKPLHTLSSVELFVWFGISWCAVATGLATLVLFRRQVAGRNGAATGSWAAGLRSHADGGKTLAFDFDRRRSATSLDRTSIGGRGSACIYRLDRKASRPNLAENSSDGQEGEVFSELRVSFAECVRHCRGPLWAAAAVSVFANLLVLTGPLFMLQVYDRVLTSKSVPTLLALFGFAAGLFAFMGVLDLIRARLLVRVGLRFDRMLSKRIFARAITPGDASCKDSSGQLIRDVQNVRQFLAGPGTTALFDMPWAPIYFGVVLLFHWMLGLVALVGTIVLITLSLINEVTCRKAVAAAAAHATVSSRLYEDGRRQGDTLKAMGMTVDYSNRWMREHCGELLVQTGAADTGGLLLVLSKTVRLLLQSAMLAMGAYLVLADQLSPGIMIASSIIMSRALAPIEQAISQWRSFIAARQGAARLRLALAGEPATGEPMMMPRPQGEVSVDTLYAGLSGQQREPILKGVCFRLSPGDALGVVGASGSGKSTLARVLAGALTPLRGTVRLDGVAHAQWAEAQIGSHIGYLAQSAELFNGTIAENISRFSPSAQASDILAAAEAAKVHQMILRLPDGYNTVVGEGGMTLSGGQRQRIALARALFGQPAFVILDEPNANLDTEGETALAVAIRSMRDRGQTVVVIAHRQKALEHVNFLLVLKDGRQATFGTKSDVLKTLSPVSKKKERAVHAAQ